MSLCIFVKGIRLSLILFIASSDFSHYESPEFGFKQDDKVVKEILNLQTDNVYSAVRKHGISILNTQLSLSDFESIKSVYPIAL